MLGVSLGQQGEAVAVQHLLQQKFVIVAKNYRCPIGEIDLVARQGRTLHFIEVKTRSSVRFGRPAEAVKAEESKKQAETIVADHAEESSNDAEISTEAPAEVAPASIESEPAKDGTVEAEVDNGNAEATDAES